MRQISICQLAHCTPQAVEALAQVVIERRDALAALRVELRRSRNRVEALVIAPYFQCHSKNSVYQSAKLLKIRQVPPNLTGTGWRSAK